MKVFIRSIGVLGFAAALCGQAAGAQGTADRVKVLRAAADALGMVRWSDIGGNVRLPGIDIVNTMEFTAYGAVDSSGTAIQAEYHVALGYNPAAMRVEVRRAGADKSAPRTIQTVRELYAWDESEPGAGLIAGKGTATPAPAALQQRLLELWTLPYGVVKAAMMAGDKTLVSSEGGVTVLTFPLGGALAGITARATLDSSNLVTRVETRPDDARGNLAMVIEYSNYADRAEVLTDIKSPGHIVRRQGGRTTLDVEVKNWETNGPYLVFPVPAGVKSRKP